MNAAPDDEARQRIESFLSESLGVPDLAYEEDIFELGLVTSMFALQLVDFVENEFEIELEDEDLERSNFNSIVALHCLVERRLASAPGRRAKSCQS